MTAEKGSTSTSPRSGGRIGFDLAQIGTPAYLWYGEDDETVPASAGRWLADQIPGSHSNLWTGHGHLPLQRDL